MAEGGVGALEDRGVAAGGISKESAVAEGRETTPEHGGVTDEGCAKVGGEAVLRDAGVGARGEEVVFQSGLDHPPADEALDADYGGDTGETCGERARDAATSDEVDGGEDEGEADHAAPQAVRPFHKVDVFELVKCHGGVEQLEFGGGAVLGELGIPVCSRERGERAGYWAPFCNTQSGRR